MTGTKLIQTIIEVVEVLPFVKVIRKENVATSERSSDSMV